MYQGSLAPALHRFHVVLEADDRIRESIESLRPAYAA